MEDAPYRSAFSPPHCISAVCGVVDWKQTVVARSRPSNFPPDPDIYIYFRQTKNIEASHFNYILFPKFSRNEKFLALNLVFVEKQQLFRQAKISGGEEKGGLPSPCYVAKPAANHTIGPVISATNRFLGYATW